jgi:hypothetical protein
MSIYHSCLNKADGRLAFGRKIKTEERIGGGTCAVLHGDNSLLHAAWGQEGGDNTTRCDVAQLIRGQSRGITLIFR